MDSETQLRTIRQMTGREQYVDGIVEIVIGVLFFIVALATGRPPFYWMYLVAILVLGRGLDWLKARFTYPRVGYARIPDEDPSRLRRGILTWVLGGFLLVAIVLTLVGHVGDNLAWRRAAPALGGVLFAGGFLHMARRSQLARHYVLMIASVIVGGLLTWPVEQEPYGNLRVWAMLMALLCLTMGASVLWRFVRANPIVAERAPNGG